MVRIFKTICKLKLLPLALLKQLMKAEEIRLKQLLDGSAVDEIMTHEDMRRDLVIYRAQEYLEWGGFVNYLKIFNMNKNIFFNYD